MADSCRTGEIPEAEGIYGRETLAMLKLLSRGFETLATILRAGSNSGFSLQVLADAGPFITGHTTKTRSVDVNVITEVYVNETGDYIVVHLQVESYILAGTATPSGLYVDTDKDKCTAAMAKRRRHGNFPELTFLMPPNTRLYAQVADTSGQAKFGFTITQVPLRGV